MGGGTRTLRRHLSHASAKCPCESLSLLTTPARWVLRGTRPQNGKCPAGEQLCGQPRLQAALAPTAPHLA